VAIVPLQMRAPSSWSTPWLFNPSPQAQVDQGGTLSSDAFYCLQVL
jgi:hypothetical protein